MTRKKSELEHDINSCLSIVTRVLHPSSRNTDGLMCRIHNALSSEQGEDHNCVGCNLDDSTLHLQLFLKSSKSCKDIQYFATAYFLMLNLIVERLEVIFNIIELPQVYKGKYFHVFQSVRRWANFVKHPKSFILCHHPLFANENQSDISGLKKDAKILIDYKFIIKFYSGSNNNTELANKLTNQRRVLVLLPDFVKLTEDFCAALVKFVDVIEQNEVYQEILNDKATIINFFSEDESNHE